MSDAVHVRYLVDDVEASIAFYRGSSASSSFRIWPRPLRTCSVGIYGSY